MSDRINRRGWIGLTLVLLNASAWAGFAGGTGEPNDPYQIATAEQLTSIGSDRMALGRHYVLVSDIDLDPNLPGGQVFTRAIIAAPSRGPFQGRFDGRGYTIYRLVLQGESGLGLFGVVGPEGVVCRVGLEGTALSARADVCGSLAGTNRGTVRECRVAGSTLRGSTETSFLGGLVGWNLGTVSSCSYTGEVLGTWDFVGGLVGYNEGTVSSCYSTANVTGRIPVGGVAGWHGGILSSVYSSGSVAGDYWVGGVVGFFNLRGALYSSYSASRVTCTHSDVGGLVGIRSGIGSGLLQDCYFLATAYGGGPDNGIGVALTPSQMRQRGSLVGWDFWGAEEDGIADTWFMPPDSYPVLTWQTEVTGLRTIPSIAVLPLSQVQACLQDTGFVLGQVRYDFHRSIPSGLGAHTSPNSYAPAGTVIDVVVSLGPYDWGTNPGDGTQVHPYQIQTPGQLEALSDHPELWNRHFVLTADVDMAGRTYATALIAPDANETEGGFQGTDFTGSLNGDAHRIDNLSILGQGRNYLGLFGVIGPSGQVQGLTLASASIVGNSLSAYVGALAGCNAGTLSDCSVAGWVTGCTRVDGLVGLNTGSLVNCHADVTLRPLCRGAR